jgi:hypothetical protein
VECTARIALGINLAAADDFLDQACGAVSVVHENTLAAGQGAVVQLVLQKLCLGAPPANMNREAITIEMQSLY